MLGSALVRRLADEDCRLLPLGREILDLRDQAAVFAWFDEYRPDVVFLAAATVGGIYANDRQPADFLYDNLAIAANVIEAARRSEVRKLVFFGTSCMYPKLAAQPIAENSLLEGPLEPTNEWYGVAKIAGVKLCQAYRRQYGCDFITVVPTNLYGPGDNFDPLQSHVIPALIRKLYDAVKEGRETVEVWGTGKPRRRLTRSTSPARGGWRSSPSFPGARRQALPSLPRGRRLDGVRRRRARDVFVEDDRRH